MRLTMLLALALLSGCFADDDSEDYRVTSTCSVTSLPTTGTLTAARINSRFTQLTGCINGSLGDSNMSTSDTIDIDKITNDSARASVTESVVCASTTANAFVYRVPAAGTLTDAFVRCRGCSAADIDVNIQVNGATQIAFTGITDTTTQTSTGNSIAVAAAQDLDFDVTVNTAGSCAALDVTTWFKFQHVP